MLTREQAKTTECPLRAAGYWANHNDNMLPGEGALNCRAEDCPKWRDIDINGACGKWTDTDMCKNRRCNACPDRFGYCGR